MPRPYAYVYAYAYVRPLCLLQTDLDSPLLGSKGQLKSTQISVSNCADSHERTMAHGCPWCEEGCFIT